jgi:hypothetical protein
VLEPGGYLVVEVPDPESPWARRLGRHWLSWFQPQHQHFLPCENMLAALDVAGFEAVKVERREAAMGYDLLLAVVMGVQRVAPSPHAPWLPPSPLALRAKRGVAIIAAVPVAAVAALADWIKDARIDPEAPGNVYRIVARRI